MNNNDNLKEKINILWDSLAGFREIQAKAEEVYKEMEPYRVTFEKAIADRTQDQKVYIRHQIELAKILSKTLIPKVSLIYGGLDDGLKQNIRNIEILPKYIRNPINIDLPVLEIITALNNSVAIAEAFLEKNENLTN